MGCLLRRKFDDRAGEARKIKTVWGKGYLFSRSNGMLNPCSRF